MRPARILTVALTVFALASSSGLAQGPGGGGRGGRGGGGRGGFGGQDPNERFNSFSNGADVWKKPDPSDYRSRFFDRIAEQVGATNGVITRQQYVQYEQQRQAERAARMGGMMPPTIITTTAPASPSTPSRTETTTPIQIASPMTFQVDTRGRGNGTGISPDILARIAEMSFSRLDKNKDGYLSFEEMPKDLQDDWQKWDTDRNGVIDLKEYMAYYIARREQRATPRGGSTPTKSIGASGSPGKSGQTTPLIYTSANLPKDLPPWFRQLDREGNAQVFLDEWLKAGRSDQEFKKYDLNGDGIITVDEVLMVQNRAKEGVAAPRSGYRIARGGQTTSGGPSVASTSDTPVIITGSGTPPNVPTGANFNRANFQNRGPRGNRSRGNAPSDSGIPTRGGN